MNNEELNKVCGILNVVTLLGDELNFPDYLALIAMCLEERCKQEGVDMIECVKLLLETSERVNEQLGKY